MNLYWYREDFREYCLLLFTVLKIFRAYWLQPIAKKGAMNNEISINKSVHCHSTRQMTGLGNVMLFKHDGNRYLLQKLCYR